jgi:fructokinase
MITVAGEALIDLIVEPAGSVSAHPGGGPFNVARMLGRLGVPVGFVGRVGADAFGDRLRAALRRLDVDLVVPAPVDVPTTLAVAELDGAGVAEYRFYLEGTAAAQLCTHDIPAGALDATDAIALGGLGLVAEPTASTLLGLAATATPGVTVLLDPNCRPSAVSDPARYAAAVRRFLARADVVKASAGDLQVLDPGAKLPVAVRNVLRAGPAAVLVTDGPAPVVIHTDGGESEIPVDAVDLVDTIGAGDAFCAGFLAWWTEHDLRRGDARDLEALTGAAVAAVRVAGAACTVAGANLPPGFRLG